MRSDDLTHLVYAASLDNSLWPELILELAKRVEIARQRDAVGDGCETERLGESIEHVARALAISERIVGLQENARALGSVLDTLSFGLAVLDHSGKVMIANKPAQSAFQFLGVSSGRSVLLRSYQGDADDKTLEAWVKQCNHQGALLQLGLAAESTVTVIMLPGLEASRTGFPPSAGAVVILFDWRDSQVLQTTAKHFDLTVRETELFGALCASPTLPAAAERLGIRYGTARKYLQSIFDKTGTGSQSELIHRLLTNPLILLRQSHSVPEDIFRVRKLLTLESGARLEYFELGPEDGYPVLFFDAHSGVTIDVLGHPERCLWHLERLNIRLIIPCRPGTFRSDPQPFQCLRDFAPVIEQLLSHAKIDRFAVAAVSFGSCSAMATAYELGDRVDRIVLSSPGYPVHSDQNWQELHQFYQLFAVVGRNYPHAYEQIIPFLIRSILQNTDAFFDRYCRDAPSKDDVRILSDPVCRARVAAMLSQRTAQGIDGMVQEKILNTRGWDFSVTGITVPVTIFHGGLDTVSPIAAAELLAAHLPNAVLHTVPEFGHFHHIKTWPGILSHAVGTDSPIDQNRFEFP